MLVACALQGLEVMLGLLSSFSIVLGLDPRPSSPLYIVIGYDVLGLLVAGVLGALLGIVLLWQGGGFVPSREEQGAGKERSWV